MTKMDVCVVGAGPAGLFAAYHAARAGARVVVVDGNALAGKKLLITGGGRCNVTHAGTARELLPAFAPYDRFLRYALHEVPPAVFIEFLEQYRIPCTTEASGCVFPRSQQAVDVRDTLVQAAEEVGVQIQLDRAVTCVQPQAGGFLVEAGRHVYPTQRVILATGGCSYPRTGSQGQGFALAARLGHRVVPPIPVLIPLRTHEAWSKRLAGTAFERVHLSTETKGKPVRETGALVFMQDGIGGPAALNLSRYLTEPVPSVDRPYRIKLDLLPDGDASSLERDLIEQCKAQPKRSISNLVAHWVPKRLAEQLCILVGCAHDLWSANLTKVQRRDLVQHLKALELSVIGTRPLAEATVTRGGVARDEIDDRTMASKIRPGLFFAGEVIDVDGPCGGYNLQICWSTGALAGRAAALRDST